MQTLLYILMSALLYIIIWYKSNAKLLYGINMSPIQWWLTTGLITDYLGLMSWWYLVKHFDIWIAMCITYCLSTIIKLGLNFYYFDAPSNQQIFGLILLVIGSFLILK